MKTFLANLYERIQREPALLVGIATAFLVLLTEFGVPLSDGQQAAVIGFVIALGAVIVRQSVTPNVSVGAHTDDLDDRHLELVAGEASALPDGTPVDVVPKDEYGHGSANVLIVVAAVLVILACLVYLIRAL